MAKSKAKPKAKPTPKAKPAKPKAATAATVVVPGESDARAFRLDPEAFQAALARVAPRLLGAPFGYTMTGAHDSLEFLHRVKYAALPATLGELFGKGSTDVPMTNFIHLLVAESMYPRTRFRVADHLALERTHPLAFFSGDLIVDGNVRFACPVLVMGDLVVSGVISDIDKGQWSPLLVAGNVSARAVSIGNEMIVGGRLDASDMLYLRFTRGAQTLAVGAGIHTRLFVETPHDSSYRGTLAAEIQIEANDSKVGPEPWRNSLLEVHQLLTAALRERYPACEDIDFDGLIDELEAGTEVLVRPR